MKRICRFFVLMFLFVFLCGYNINALQFGDESFKYVEQISRIQRGAFTEGEVYTADYLGRVLRDLGYDTVFEEITFPEGIKVDYTQGYYLSHNIIATKKGLSDLEVVIGAAYDSEEVVDSTGFEAATGPAVLLEIATKVKDLELPYTLKFVLFGAGKIGNIGATHYVTTRSQDEINKIMYFIDLSSIGSGKDLYVFGNEGIKGFVRDDLLKLSDELGLNVLTSPEDAQTQTPEGVGYDIGDQVPFKYSNVPFGVIQATSFESLDEDYRLPNDPTGEGIGIIQGSSYDNYDYVMENFGDNVKSNLSKTSELVYNELYKKDKSIKVITMLSEYSLPMVGEIKYQLFKDGKKIEEASPDENFVVEFKNLKAGNYTIEITAPENIKFIKDISKFEFNFDENSNGEYVFLNDEIYTYTYRSEFTDNFNLARKIIQDEQYEIKAKRLLFDYSGSSEGDYNEEKDDSKNDLLIKNLSIILAILVVLYIFVRIILHFINRKKG